MTICHVECCSNTPCAAIVEKRVWPALFLTAGRGSTHSSPKRVKRGTWMISLYTSIRQMWPCSGDFEHHGFFMSLFLSKKKNKKKNNIFLTVHVIRARVGLRQHIWQGFKRKPLENDKLWLSFKQPYSTSLVKTASRVLKSIVHYTYRVRLCSKKKNVFLVLCHCHTKRRIGGRDTASPSFGMKPTTQYNLWRPQSTNPPLAVL